MRSAPATARRRFPREPEAARGRPVRVVAGELKGRRLASPGRGAEVRPTADRVREAIFSSLGRIEGAEVLDLFCGTGALAIEAISRGAATAVLVDTRTGLARRNVSELGLEDRCRVVRGDALRFLRRSRRRFDLIFCDPPYRLAARLGSDLDQLVPGHLAEGGRLITESAARRPLELSLPLLTERRYGDTVVRVHLGNGADPAAGRTAVGGDDG
jgi:16S rRNA (guanine966-N2)-methyltransferase